MYKYCELSLCFGVERSKVKVLKSVWPLVPHSGQLACVTFQVSAFLLTNGGGYSYDSTSSRLRLDDRSTPNQLQFDRATTVLRYGLPFLDCCTAV